MIEIVGHTAIDHICSVLHLPKADDSTHITERKILFGGGAANIAAGIATLGGTVSLLSAVGDDFSGSEYDAWLQKLGVTCRFFTVPGANTPSAFVFTDTKGKQMTFFEWGASAVFKERDPPDVRYVHLATADPGFNVKVAEKAEFVSFDPGQDLHLYKNEDLKKILAQTTILFANQFEMAGMCEELQVSREELVSRVPVAVMTKGKDGSVLYTHGKEEIIPAIPVCAVDPTGAGDAYRAGFLTAFMDGYDLVTCARIGTITASYVVSVIGCQTNLASFNLMKARYEDVYGRFPLPGKKPYS